MIGNISILLFSSLFIFIITFYIYKKWPDLDVIDLYIIFILFHFGLYPFVRGLYFGKDVIFDFRHSNPLAIGLVFAQVLIIIAIIRWISLYFSPSFANNLKINSLIDKWSCVNKYILLSLYVWLILFQIISYYKYGVKTYIVDSDFARIGKELPYWFTSMRTIYNQVAFLVFIGLFANLLRSKKYHRYFWFILIIIFVPFVTIYGRRFFLDMVAASGIFWFVYRQEDIFKLKFLKVCLLLLLTFLIFSNLFQAYRPIFQKVGKVNWDKLENPLSAALNFEATIHNLEARPGTWEFSFLVFNHQLNKPGMTTHGKINWEGFKSAIPRYFWPDKHFVLIDQILSKLYGVNPKSIDIGKNLFGVCQVDFGSFSLIIVPSIILLIIILLGFLVKISNNYPIFLWLFSGNILFFLINVEENGNEIFFMLRNIAIIMILFGFYAMGDKIFRAYLHKPREN